MTRQTQFSKYTIYGWLVEFMEAEPAGGKPTAHFVLLRFWPRHQIILLEEERERDFSLNIFVAPVVDGNAPLGQVWLPVMK